jgi:hypothetical protein
MSDYQIHAYLAGPDIFYPDAVERGALMKQRLLELGIIGHFPFDNEIPKELFQDPDLAAMTIAQANEKMMLDCCQDGRIGIILANMNPYHGPSMDVGTAFEIGFMSALASTKSNVIILGYTANPKPFEQRVIEQFGGQDRIVSQNGIPYGPDGNMIESFGQVDNLMLPQAIQKTGGRIVSNFEEAATLAYQLAQQRIIDLSAQHNL